MYENIRLFRKNGHILYEKFQFRFDGGISDYVGATVSKLQNNTWK